MSNAMISGALWIILALITAMIPIQKQLITGLMLMFLGPLIAGWIAVVEGPLYALIATLVYIFMMWRPIAYLICRAQGRDEDDNL